jgi:hypothetical protein
MTTDDTDTDVAIGALSVLTTHAPDSARAARVRARCHAVLQKRERRPLVALATPHADWRRALEPAIVGSLCAVYLFEVLSRALRLYRF